MKNNEEWKPVNGYEGRYEISNQGRVKSLKRFRNNGKTNKCIVPEKILKPYAQKINYSEAAALLKNGSTIRDLAQMYDVKENSIYKAIYRKRIV